MNRIVYLFELDSARKHNFKDNNTVYETEGVHALFHEIIDNGNTVAISMNQLTDSQFFAQAVENDYSYSILLELFRKGALRVNLFKDIRTASQYIQGSVQKCLNKDEDSFVFSNLNVAYEEQELLQIIKDALVNSDLSKLNERRDTATDQKEKDRMEYITRYIRMILNLSVNETSNIPRKTTSYKEFEFFYEHITGILSAHTFDDRVFDKQIKDAIAEVRLRSLQVTEKRYNRSNWLYFKDGREALSPVAAEIINLCYNYTIEESINGATKSYYDGDFEDTFVQDLIRRTEINCREATPVSYKKLPKRKWRMALRYASYKKQSPTETSGRYQDTLLKEQRRWTLQVFRKTLNASVWALLYLGIFILTEMFISQIEGYFTLPLNNLLLTSVLSIAIVGIISSLLNLLLSKLSKNKSMPDILECLIDIVLRGADLLYIIPRRLK